MIGNNNSTNNLMDEGFLFFDFSTKIIAINGDFKTTIFTPFIGYKVPICSTEPYIKISYPWNLMDGSNKVTGNNVASIELGIEDVPFALNSNIEFRIKLDFGGSGIKDWLLPNKFNVADPSWRFDGEFKISF